MRALKIALADHDPGTRAELALWLTKLGHTVVATDDDQELAALCRGGFFDLAIADVDDGGPAAAAAVFRECGIPVLLAGDRWTHELALDARQAGAVCLDKPILPLVLVAHLEEVCARSRRKQLAAV